MKRAIFVIAVLCLCWGNSINAATVNCAVDCGTTCSAASVQAAHDLESTVEGDSIAIPAGTCTWTGAVTVTKPVTIQGAGVASTVITHAQAGGASLIALTPSDPTKVQRVTGIYFENTDFVGVTHTDVYFSGQQFRIDHCTFHLGKYTLLAGASRNNGVIDANTFIDVDLGVRIADLIDVHDSQYPAASWDRTIAIGTSDNVFFENNTITTTNRTGCNDLNETPYHYNGARSVVRYNTYNNACTEVIDTVIDAHGIAGSDRGTVISDVYNNEFNFNNLNTVGKLRGGSHLWHGNAFNATSGTPYIKLWNEYSATDPDGWPSQDQILNSFFWGNKINGTPTTDIIGVVSGSESYIQAGRDYWLAAPQATGGKESFGGRAGFANESCSANGTANLWGVGYDLTNGLTCCSGSGTGTCNMAFSSSGANAYYPYSMYTCPHPLTGLSSNCSATVAGTTGYNPVGGAGPAFSGGLCINCQVIQ